MGSSKDPRYSRHGEVNNLRTLAKSFTPPPAYQDYVEFVQKDFRRQAEVDAFGNDRSGLFAKSIERENAPKAA